jgi:hypothetical protein
LGGGVKPDVSWALAMLGPGHKNIVANIQVVMPFMDKTLLGHEVDFTDET